MLIAILNVEHGVADRRRRSLVALAVGRADRDRSTARSIVLLGIDSLIVTLGTGTLLGGRRSLWISDSNTISGVSQTLVDAVIVERLFGIPLEFYYGLGLCVVLWYVFEFTPLGPPAAVRRPRARGRPAVRASGSTRIRWRRARRLRRRQRARRACSTPGRPAPPTRPRAALPAAGFRGGVPGRDHDHAGPLQPVGHGHRGLLPGHRHHRPAAARRARASCSTLLRRRARPRRRRSRSSPAGREARDADSPIGGPTPCTTS